MSTETIAPTPVPAAPEPKQFIALGNAGVQLQSIDEAFRFAKAVAMSGFAPKGLEKPESILIAIQHGMELGLRPMAALQSIAIINGRPGIYGDAALALVRGSGLMESYAQRTEGEGDKLRAVVTVKRKGENAMESVFSVADAKVASLWGKQGPWSQYPTRMLLFRARGFALRDAFGDVLKGMRTTEELQDIPPEPRNVTPPLGDVLRGPAKVEEPALQSETAALPTASAT